MNSTYLIVCQWNLLTSQLLNILKSISIAYYLKMVLQWFAVNSNTLQHQLSFTQRECIPLNCITVISMFYNKFVAQRVYLGIRKRTIL